MLKVSEAFMAELSKRAVPAPRTTALGIPCPWSGNENDPVPRSYHAWFWLYSRTRRLRHRFGLHDFQHIHALNARRCTWCGHSAA